MKKDEINLIIPIERIENVIYVIRDHKVILDQDLAKLYGVSTGNFNKAINRNQKRFPEDFAFRLTKKEWGGLIFQIGISKKGRGGRQKLPMAFTEHGVAMTANLLKSNRAIAISVEIVRAFIRMRQVLANHKEMTKELSDLKNFVLKHSNSNDREFKRIWNTMERLAKPNKNMGQRQIGFDLSQVRLLK